MAGEIILNCRNCEESKGRMECRSILTLRCCSSAEAELVVFEAAKRHEFVDSFGNSLAVQASSSISSLACCQSGLHFDRQFAWAARSAGPEVFDRSGPA
jgi:hypothetical protein